MTVEHSVRLSKTIKRLDDVGDDVPDGLAGFAAGVDPSDLTVSQLMELRQMQIPATMVTTTAGGHVWLLMRYVEKIKKGSKARAKVYFYSRSGQELTTIPWLAEIAPVLSSGFTLGGWPFPLKQIATPDTL